MPYLPITASWIVSRRAQRLYCGCAIANAGLFRGLVGMQVVLIPWSFNRFGIANLLVKAVLWPCIVGTAILWVAMWYFWFTFDRSGWVKRALWFAVMCLGFALGPPLYYIFGYRRNSALEGRT
jgi:hypothetical protein